MNVTACFHRRLYPLRDGEVAYLDGILKTLSNSNSYHITLFTYDNSVGCVKRSPSNNKKYTIVSIPSLFRIKKGLIERVLGAINALINPSMYVLLTKAAKDTDIYYCQDTYCGFCALFVSHVLKRKKLIFRASNTLLALAIQRTKEKDILGPPMFLYALIFESLIIRLADAVITPSDKEKILLSTYYKRKEGIHVFPPAFDEPSPSPEKRRARIREELGLENDTAPLLIFMGTAKYQPNLIALNYIFDDLSPYLFEKMPIAKILLIGEGCEAIASEKKKGNIVALGEVEDVEPYLESADIGLVPMTVAGGVSTKTIHYLLYGLPTVTTHAASRGIDQICGLHVTTISAFKETVADVLRQFSCSETKAEYRKMIREQAIARYTWQRLYPELDKLFQKVLRA